MLIITLPLCMYCDIIRWLPGDTLHWTHFLTNNSPWISVWLHLKSIIVIHWHNKLVSVRNNDPYGNIPVDDTASCSPNTHAPIVRECYPCTELDKEQILCSHVHSHMTIPPAYSRIMLDENVLEAVALQHEFDSSWVPCGLARMHWCNIVQLLEHKIWV
jgi:hypothetical protein